jgi:GTP-binding protein Era
MGGARLAYPPCVEHRCALVGLAGRPNVGKSTLVNAIVGEHVTITSNRPQTTRRRIAGIAHGSDWQLVLCDLPGVQIPRDGLTERMAGSVEETLADVDLVLLVLDASQPIGGGDRASAELAFGSGAPVVIALNKVDRLPPERIAAAIETAGALGDFAELHPVSAKTGEGVPVLVEDLVRLAPAGPALFPPEARSSDPVRLQIAELIREQALRRLRDEVPHALTVVVEEYDPPTRRRAARIEAAIYVESKSQQGIVIGAGGSMVKAIGSAARPEIERVLGAKAMLDLRVKAQRGWRDDPALLDRLGP